MSVENKRIFIVDDEPANCRLLEQALSDSYQTSSFINGQACLSALTLEKPEAILLDVKLPDINGFNVCQSIRRVDDFEKVPVIFLSALDSIESKLEGYAAGGDDYLTKPLDIEEVKAKLKRNLDKYQDNLILQKSSALARQTAMTAMINGGEIGAVNKLFAQFSTCNDFEQLADATLETLSNFGLHAVLLFKTESDEVIHSNNGIPQPLEVELLRQAQGGKRIIELAQRNIYNFRNVSLLIRNMPTNDSDKYGRYRDHVSSIMGGVESRLENISLLLAHQNFRKETLLNALFNTHQALDTIIELFKSHDQQTKDILDNFLSNMQLAFSYLNLSEEQEEYLLNIVNGAMDKLVSLYTSGIMIDREFDSVIQSLVAVIENNDEKA